MQSFAITRNQNKTPQKTKTKYNKKPKLLGLREPDLMIVVTGGKMAYSRPDGVKIIPLACFKD